MKLEVLTWIVWVKIKGMFPFLSTKNTIKEDVDEILTVFHAPLRFLGCTNTDSTLEEISKFFATRDDFLSQKLKKLSIDDSNLPESWRNTRFHSWVALLAYSNYEEYKTLLEQSGLTDVGDGLFLDKFWWYDFSHSFISQKSWSIKDYVTGRSSWYLNTIKIDAKAIYDTCSEVWERDFNVLEKVLASIYLIANHDATIHSYGLVAVEWSDIGNLLYDHFNFWELSNSTVKGTEFFAGLFHNDILSEVWETNSIIHDFVLKNTKKALSVISKIEDPKLQVYWKAVLKYPLFSILPTDQQELRSIYSELGISLKPTKWGNAVNQKVIFTKTGKEVIVRDLRKAVMKDLHWPCVWWRRKQKWIVNTMNYLNSLD